MRQKTVDRLVHPWKTPTVLIETACLGAKSHIVSEGNSPAAKRKSDSVTQSCRSATSQRRSVPRHGQRADVLSRQKQRDDPGHTPFPTKLDRKPVQFPRPKGRKWPCASPGVAPSTYFCWAAPASNRSPTVEKSSDPPGSTKYVSGHVQGWWF